MLALRSGTSSDGRALFYVGAGPNRASAIRDLRSRDIPSGWTLEEHTNGIDLILTSNEVRS
jgi:hypothetical protein